MEQDPSSWARLSPAVERTGRSRHAAVPASEDRDPDAAAGPAPEPVADPEPSTGPVPWVSSAGAQGAVPSLRRPRSRRSRAPRPARAGLLTRLLVGLGLPLGLLALGIRLVATPLFLWVEYHRPGFPEDPYGLSRQERLTLGAHGMDYVMNWAPPAFLSSVRTPSGASWFRPEEVAHMTDVKGVLQVGLWAAAAVAALAAAAAWRRRGDVPGLARAARTSAWCTLGALAVLGLLAAVAWQAFFAGFHALFFRDGTWTFRLSDTLIRLYPDQFWVDAAAVIALVLLLGCAATILAAGRAIRSRTGTTSGRARRRRG